MKEIIFNLLKKEGYLSSDNRNSIALNKIKFEDKSVLIEGNKLGLILLSEYILQIALSELNNDHIHLDDLNFFDEANVELIISKSE